MRILMDPAIADSGTISYRKGIKLRYLEQHPKFAQGQTVRDVLYQSEHPGLEALRQYESIVAEGGDAHAMQLALDKVEATGGWTVDGRIQEMHGKMNLPAMDRIIDKFSGGEIKRLAMAQLFIEEPDLILMDEPTNHLDLDIIEWLEEYLIGYQGALLMITHDRYFLERVCGTIYELDNHAFFKYDGNYSYFLEKKELRETNQAANLHKVKQLFKKELDWMRRTPSARTGKAKDRIDRFGEVKKLAKQRVDDREVSLAINSQRLGGKILRVAQVRQELPGQAPHRIFQLHLQKRRARWDRRTQRQWKIYPPQNDPWRGNSFQGKNHHRRYRHLRALQPRRYCRQRPPEGHRSRTRNRRVHHLGKRSEAHRFPIM